MKGSCIIIVLLSIALVASIQVSSPFQDCSGTQNQNPVLYPEAQKLASVNNGEKYIFKNGTNYVYLVNLKGTPKQMGEAYGQLLKEEVAYNAINMFKYIEKEISDAIATKMPKFLVNLLTPAALSVLEGLLDLNYYIAEPYIPRRFPQEMKGISKGADFSYLTIRRLNMFPELIQASCTIVGAWGPSTLNEKLIHLRALDWSSDAPINKYPLITVYHSTEEGSYPFANIGYAGLIGTLTGFSSQGISISEKVWMPRNSSVKWTYFGKPWTFVLRDLTQFETTLQGAINTLFNTHRTVRIHIGIGAGNSKLFEGVEYSKNELLIFNDKNYTYTPAHPQLDGVMFWDKHVQPSNNPCVGSILQYYYSQISTSTLWSDVAGLSQTGDTQMCVFDVYEHSIYLSYSEFGTNIPAYLRSPIYINLKPFWLIF